MPRIEEKDWRIITPGTLIVQQTVEVAQTEAFESGTEYSIDDYPRKLLKCL